MTDYAFYIGKHLLVGLTYVDAEGQVVEQTQLHGIITQITEEGIFLNNRTAKISRFLPISILCSQHNRENIT